MELYICKCIITAVGEHFQGEIDVKIIGILLYHPIAHIHLFDNLTHLFVHALSASPAVVFCNINCVAEYFLLDIAEFCLQAYSKLKCKKENLQFS